MQLPSSYIKAIFAFSFVNFLNPIFAFASDGWLVEAMSSTDCILAKKIITRELMYGNSYTFELEMENDGSSDIGIQSVSLEYAERSDFNGSVLFPEFDWNTTFVESNYQLSQGTKVTVYVAKEDYPVNFVSDEENTGDGVPDLLIAYKVKYLVQSGDRWDGPFEEVTSCIRYDIQKP